MEQDNKKAVFWLQFAHFIIDCYPGFIAPMLPFITAKVGVEMAAAMTIISIANVSSYLLQPIFGYFADRCQKRFFIFWGIIIASIFIPMMGLAKSYAALTIAIVIGEIGVGFFHPQSTSFVPLFCKNAEQSKLNMGIFLSMGSFAYGAGALIATRLYDNFGETSLIYTSIVGVLTAFSMFIFIPKMSCHTKEEKKENKPHFLTGIKDIFSNSLERILIFASIVKSIIISSFTMIMPFYWKSIGFNATKIGYISCIFLATSTAGMILSPKIEKLIGSRNTFYFAFLSILPLALLTVWLIKVNIYLAILFYSIIGFSAFLIQPINVVMSQKLLPQYKSMISGVVGGFTWGVVGASLPVIGFFAQKIGILQAMIVISCIPLIFCYWVREIPKRPIE